MQSDKSSQVTKRSAAGANGDRSVESSDNRQPTLMDQWKEHYNNRDFTTKPYHLHRMGLITYLYCLLAVPLYSVLYVLPAMNLSTAQWIGITIASLFVMTENIFNFFACINRHHDKDQVYCFHCNQDNAQVVAGAKNSTSPTDGWRHCLQCQKQSPPRSHHCKICRVCVLRRDHHCYFLSCCIGHHNQKHFLVLCFYSAIGLIMGLYFISIGLTDNFQQPGNLVLPVTVWHWIVGKCALTSIGLVLSLYLQTGCLAVTSVYLFLESVLVLRGQTFFEMSRNIRRYNLGAWNNLRSSFGAWHLWPLLLLYPADIEQAADGVNWNVTKHN